MTPWNKQEYLYDLHETVIKHFLNGDSEREIARKVLIPRTSTHRMIQKYKSTKHNWPRSKTKNNNAY